MVYLTILQNSLFKIHYLILNNHESLRVMNTEFTSLNDEY